MRSCRACEHCDFNVKFTVIGNWDEGRLVWETDYKRSAPKDHCNSWTNSCDYSQYALRTVSVLFRL